MSGDSLTEIPIKYVIFFVLGSNKIQFYLQQNSNFLFIIIYIRNILHRQFFQRYLWWNINRPLTKLEVTVFRLVITIHSIDSKQNVINFFYYIQAVTVSRTILCMCASVSEYVLDSCNTHSLSRQQQVHRC